MPEGHAPVIREMIIPIMREDRIVAIIGMGNKPTDYNEADIEIASLLGDFSWEIVERKRAEEVLAESKRLSDALNEINASISSTLDFDEIMQRIIDEAATAIGTETGAIIFREGDHWLTKYSYGYEENIVGVILTDKEAPHAALAAKLKKPVVINDAYNDPGVNLEIMKRYSIRSVITVPLIARGTTIGILFLNYHTAPVAFTEAQIDFASKLSVSISLAIENARLYEAERNIADSLQSALIKIPEHIEGVEYGYLYRSATEATKVGGDFFDIFELEHDKVGIMVGDVSGKGLEAASITSLVRNTVRAYAYEEESPAVIMAKTNDAVKKSTPASYFVTLFLGIVDMKSGALTYCSAGHPPALLKRKTSGVVLLDVGSPILGAFAGLSYDDGSATIEEGDILVLYTDGVTEARCNGGFFGDERLVAFLETLQGVSAKDTSQVVFSEVMSCTGGELSDDVVLFSFSLGAEVRHNA
jgi:GAF domain-containing protein